MQLLLKDEHANCCILLKIIIRIKKNTSCSSLVCMSSDWAFIRLSLGSIYFINWAELSPQNCLNSSHFLTRLSLNELVLSRTQAAQKQLGLFWALIQGLEYKMLVTQCLTVTGKWIFHLFTIIGKWIFHEGLNCWEDKIIRNVATFYFTFYILDRNVKWPVWINSFAEILNVPHGEEPLSLLAFICVFCCMDGVGRFYGTSCIQTKLDQSRLDWVGTVWF